MISGNIANGNKEITKWSTGKINSHFWAFFIRLNKLKKALKILLLITLYSGDGIFIYGASILFKVALSRLLLRLNSVLLKSAIY